MWRPPLPTVLDTISIEFAQSLTLCSASNLKEARRVSSLWPGASPAKTRASSMPSRAHGPHLRRSTHCSQLCEGGLGVLRSAAPGLHLTLRVKQVGQRRRFEPDLGGTANPFGREGQDIAMEVAHERADSYFQLVGVTTLFHEDHEHGTQEARTALLHALILLRVPGLGHKQLPFLQQDVQPVIRQVLG